MPEENKSEYLTECKKINSEDKNNLNAYILFLQSILDKTIIQTNNLDGQTNILLGVASALFVYSTARINSEQSVVFTILSIFSALSVLICMISIHPPKRLRIKNKHESVKSLLGNKRITSYASSQDYADRLMTVYGDTRAMTDHYAAAVYNTNVNYYRPKRNLFKIAVKVLITGITLAVLLIIYQALTK